MSQQKSLIRIYGLGFAISVLLIGVVGFVGGLSAFLTVLILAGLEVTFSFENAVINAKILQHMSKIWQTIFLTLGILVAVFVVRLILPIIIVALSIGLSPDSVVEMALHQPDAYAAALESAKPIIAAFGGIFLLMIFLDFILEDRKVRWLVNLETLLARVGKLENVSVLIAIITLLTAASFVPEHEELSVIVSGLIGLAIYLAINAIASAVGRGKIEQATGQGSQVVVKTGLIGFLYLELIDASFSLDGVIGAFAITTKVLLITIGLGIGALFVRSITIHMLRHGVFEKYRYLEHGAHYAIGLLAALMLISITKDIPQAITGLMGIVVIAAAVLQSKLETRRHKIESKTN